MNLEELMVTWEGRKVKGLAHYLNKIIEQQQEIIDMMRREEDEKIRERDKRRCQEENC